MKKILWLFLVIGIAGCGEKAVVNNTNKPTSNNANGTATAKPTEQKQAEQKPSDISKSFSDKTMNLDERVTAIQQFVDEVERRLPRENGKEPVLERKEIMLKPDSLKAVTDEKWEKLHLYSDGATLKRLKVYAPAGSNKSEEFYFYNNKPVFVFVEPNGKNKEADDAGAQGEKFYFGEEGLISWIKSDGTKVNQTDENFKKYNDKLKKEADEFRNAK